MVNQIKTRKPLEERCPKCGSSQIHKRKLQGTWLCRKCKGVFLKPKSDVVNGK